MRTRMLLILSMYLVLPALAAKAGIINLTISPLEPTSYDPITIHVSGEAGYSPVWVNTLDFRANGNNLELDLSVTTGPYAMVAPWSYSENIGYLSSGVYDIKVNAIYSPATIETCATTFEVIPEPASLLLLVIGLPLLRKTSRCLR